MNDADTPRPVALLTRSNLRDAARDAVRSMIFSGQLPVGQPVRQDELAAQLGISRTPLREALQALVAEGLMHIDPRGAAVVTKPSPAELLETYELREVLETVAGRLAATLSTPEHVEHLRKLHKELCETTNPDLWAERNAVFHSAVYAITAKPQLIEFIDVLRNRAKLYVRILAAAEAAPHRHADDEHGRMIEALRANDPDAMEEIVRTHLRSTAKVVAPLLSDPSS